VLPVKRVQVRGVIAPETGRIVDPHAACERRPSLRAICSSAGVRVISSAGRTFARRRVVTAGSGSARQIRTGSELRTSSDRRDRCCPSPNAVVSIHTSLGRGADVTDVNPVCCRWPLQRHPDETLD